MKNPEAHKAKKALINNILNAYHTTRLSESSPDEHIITRLGQRLNDLILIAVHHMTETIPLEAEKSADDAVSTRARNAMMRDAGEAEEGINTLEALDIIRFMATTATTEEVLAGVPDPSFANLSPMERCHAIGERRIKYDTMILRARAFLEQAGEK